MSVSLPRLTATTLILFSCSDPGEGERAQSTAGAISRPVVTSVSPQAKERLKKAYRRTLEKPRDPNSFGRLGMILNAYEQYESAQQCYRQAAGLDADSSRWTYFLGTILSEQGRVEESIGWFRRSLELHPGDLATRLRLAGEILKSGNDTESHSIYAAVLSERPETPAAHLGIGQIESQRGNPAAALRHFQRAAARLSDYGPLHYSLALVYRELGREEAARSSMARFERLGPTRQPPFADPLMDEIVALKTGSYLYHLNQGRRMAAAGRPIEAIAEYRRAADIEPENAQAHVNLIAGYGTIAEFDKAEEHFRKAVDINPDLEEAYYNLGTLWTMQSRYSEAIEAFQNALRVNPFSAEAHNSLGYALERVGRHDDAVVHYRSALEYEPANRLAHFNLGRYLFGSGKTEPGIRHLEQTLLPEDEQTPQFLLVLARSYRNSGRSEEAVAHGQRAKSLAEQFGQKGLADLADSEFGTP
jgi:tetratricopeptide (TPR) repeat protein